VSYVVMDALELSWLTPHSTCILVFERKTHWGIVLRHPYWDG